MSETHELKVYPFSYSRCASDSECHRKRYLAREWGGTGLQPIAEGWDLVHGNIMHKALETLAKEGQLDYTHWRQTIVQEALKGKMDQLLAADWGALSEGLLRGFVKTVWPYLMAEYEIVDTERWLELDFTEQDRTFKFRARQDLLLRNKQTGRLTMVDYKGCSTTKPQWIKSWSKSVQMHTSCYASAKLGTPIDDFIVIGLYKGYHDEKKGSRRSPLTWAYVNREYGMTPTYSYEYARGRGWELFSTASEFNDLANWVAQMPVAMLTEQFPQTAPISPRADIAETWFRQQLLRERDVADAVQLLHSCTDMDQIQSILDKYFPQDFSKCDPAYGYGCEFTNLCWIPFVGADPVGSGQYKRYESSLEGE